MEQHEEQTKAMHTIHNDTDAVKYVGLHNGGSVAVMPGESRPFPISELAPAWRPDPAAEPTADDLTIELDEHIAALAASPAKEIIALVPDMETSLLVALGEAEQKRDEPRKTVLGAIAEEQLKRAEAEQAHAVATSHIAGAAE